MTRPECPLPQVEDALTPFIHTREKTTRIRQILTEHLKRQVKDDIEPTHLSLSIPPSSLRATGDSAAPHGIYDQYLRALRAHQQAREHYEEVKGELDQLVQTKPETKNGDGKQDELGDVSEYADLLRQRRHQRKLELIQDAQTKLFASEPSPAATDIKAAVIEELGEPPQPPLATGIDGGASDAEARVSELTFTLKKELLLAKSKFAHAKATQEDAQKERASNGTLSTNERVALIRATRDELITWVEAELAKIPEDEVEASQAEISFIGAEDEDGGESGPPLSNEDLSKRVEQLYAHYLASRQRYISEVEAALERASKLQPTPDATSGAPLQSTGRQTMSFSPPDPVSSTICASDVLPALAHLNFTAQTATLLQSQTSHLRKQLTTASSETQSLIQRLAGESLLVPQDSTSVKAWAKAASGASDKTKDTVMSNVIEGEASVAQTKKVLEGLRARRKGLEGLKRDL